MKKRVSKAAGLRKHEIMVEALAQFQEKGYEHTSVESIIRSIDIAKGTFYHYFKTKQELLASVVTHITEQLCTHYAIIALDASLPPLEKLKQMIRGNKKKVIAKKEIMDGVKRAENRALQESMNIACIEKVAPILLTVFHEGYQQGLFSKKITLETLQLLLSASQFTLDSGLFMWPQEKERKLLKALQRLLENAVGAEAASLNFIAQP